MCPLALKAIACALPKAICTILAFFKSFTRPKNNNRSKFGF